MDPDLLRRRVEQSRSMCGTSLKLGIADITDEYALPISEVVKKRPILEEVQLYGNRITNIGCEVFATLLRDTNCNLRKLNLHNNDIGNEGAIVLAESLFGNTKLKTLWMSYNRFDNADAQRVQDAFTRLLCNTESINSIYCSNHTIEDLTVSYKDLPHRPLIETVAISSA